MGQLRPFQNFGPFQLERRLGVGGMAEVWLARSLEKFARFPRVVVKRMHNHLTENPHMLGLFRDEALLLERLKHPRIVAMLSSGRIDGDYYLAMEYVDGLDFGRCQQAHGGPLWPSLAALLATEACEGLAYAHALEGDDGPLNLVHRDISPDNLMVDVSGGVKIVDFGIARARTTEVTTKAGNRKGKVRYMAPEYMRGDKATARSDVYSLGATLFELCTGNRPFEGLKAPQAIAQAAQNDGIPSAAEVRPSLPEELVETIAACTQLDPADRPSSAGQVETALRRFLTHYAPPDPSELGALVGQWRARLDSSLGGDKRPPAGAYGQLETTEYVKVRDGPPKRIRVQAGPIPSLEVARVVDPTDFEIPIPSADLVDHDRPTDPHVRRPNLEPSVILAPDLEASAHRSGAKKPRRKRR